MNLRSILKGIPLFKHLDDEDLELLASHLHRESYPKGTILFNEGDIGDTMYLVESGQLAVVGDDARETIAFMGPGNFVGDISLLLAQPRTATVQVTIDVNLWILHKKNFDTLIDTRPSIALEMMRELSRRLVTTNRRKRTVITRRITALAGGHKGVELSEAVQTHLKGLVGILPLPLAHLGETSPADTKVLFLDNKELNEGTLAESLSHQIEVYKHIIIVLPEEPNTLAYKAVDLADTVVSVGAPPPWLRDHPHPQELWITSGAKSDLLRTARKLTNKTVGLALSSGGTRGLAHVGVLKVFAEEKIPIDIMAGSSAGALFGALVAAGWTFEQIGDFIKNLKGLTHFSNWDLNIPPLTGLVKGRKARDKYLARPLNHATFADLKIPMCIVAGDILTGEEFVFDSGSVADAIRASASIPILGDPWLHEGHYLIDGGVVNPLPASVLRERGANIIIASNVVQPLREAYSGAKDKMPDVFRIISNVIIAMEAEMIKKQLPLIDVLIHHNVSAQHSLDFEHTNDLIRVGEEAARQVLPMIREVLETPIEI